MPPNFLQSFRQDDDEGFAYSGQVVGSFPKMAYGYDDELDHEPFAGGASGPDTKPRILLMGLKR